MSGRNWETLLNHDVKKNPDLKKYVENIGKYSIEELNELDIKKDIKKRLLILKEKYGVKEDIKVDIDQRNRIEKCISFGYTEDKNGKIYFWNSNTTMFDITNKDGYYEIYPNQPFWISDDNKLMKMDTFTFESINPQIFNQMTFYKDGTMSEYNSLCSEHRENLFNTQGGEIIEIGNTSQTGRSGSPYFKIY